MKNKENILEFIESAVKKQPKLNLKPNKGGHHRIINTGWYGSLWIVKTATNGFRVETTGTVGTSLNPEIRNFLGRENERESVKGYKIWFVENPSDVEKIIGIYGKL